jgi:sec-independent protein translocase protein TatA
MEVVLVLAIALIVLGPKKLPEAARSIGNGLREFKESVSGSGEDDADDHPLDPEPTKSPR